MPDTLWFIPKPKKGRTDPEEYPFDQGIWSSSSSDSSNNSESEIITDDINMSETRDRVGEKEQEEKSGEVKIDSVIVGFKGESDVYLRSGSDVSEE